MQHGFELLQGQNGARSNWVCHLNFEDKKLEAEYKASLRPDMSRGLLALELAAVVVAGVLACLGLKDEQSPISIFFRINNLVTILCIDLARRMMRCQQSLRRSGFFIYVAFLHFLFYQSLTQTRAVHTLQLCGIASGGLEGTSDDEAYAALWCICGVIGYYFVFADSSTFFSVSVFVTAPLVWLSEVLLIGTSEYIEKLLGVGFTYLLASSLIFAFSRRMEILNRINFLQSHRLALEIGKLRATQKGLQRVLAMNFDASDAVGLDFVLGKQSPVCAILSSRARGEERFHQFGHGPKEQQRLLVFFTGLKDAILEDPGSIHGPDRLTATLTVDDQPIDFEVQSVWMPYDLGDDAATSQPLGSMWIGLRRHQVPDSNVEEHDLNWDDVVDRSSAEDLEGDGSRSQTGAGESDSLPNTTVTGNVFADVMKLRDSESLKNLEHGSKEELQERLRKVAELGQAEGWLFGTMDLELVPERVLGHGGFGVVVTAKLHGARVAVKLPRSADTKGSVRHMISMANELRILRKVRHPRVATFHGAFIDAPTCELCLVFELVQGVQMDKFIRPPPMSPCAARRHALMYDVACALSYLHSQDPPIIHGDLKPANVMVERLVNGLHAKLVDFGSSRVQTRHAVPLGGTLQWKAPEVVLHDSSTPAPSADVFSFGLLVYFVVTGLKPFPGLPPQAIRHLRRRGRNMPCAWPRGVELIEECKALCSKCVRSDAASRPAAQHLQASIVSWRAVRGSGENPRESVAQGKPSWEKQVKELRLLLSQQAPEAPEGKAGAMHAQPSMGQQQRRRYPAFQETPEASKKLILKAVLAQWNIPLPDDRCCDFHAGLSEGLSVLQELQMESCTGDNTTLADSQCPRCGLIDACEGITNCTMCRLMSSADAQGTDDRHEDLPEPVGVRSFMSL